jgi:hypothetical protein
VLQDKDAGHRIRVEVSMASDGGAAPPVLSDPGPLVASDPESTPTASPAPTVTVSPSPSPSPSPTASPTPTSTPTTLDAPASDATPAPAFSRALVAPSPAAVVRPTEATVVTRGRNVRLRLTSATAQRATVRILLAGRAIGRASATLRAGAACTVAITWTTAGRAVLRRKAQTVIVEVTTASGTASKHVRVPRLR